jgi:hypothetical protein
MSGGPPAGSNETRKSSAEATPSGVSQVTSSGSNETQKSSAEATPSGVLSNITAAASTSSSRNGGKTRGTSLSRSGAGRAAKPPRQKCPHCGKWGAHRPDECWSRPAGRKSFANTESPTEQVNNPSHRGQPLFRCPWGPCFCGGGKS